MLGQFLCIYDKSHELNSIPGSCEMGGMVSVGALWYKFIESPRQHLLMVLLSVPFNYLPCPRACHLNQGFVANNLIVCKYFKFLIQKVFLKRILLSSNYVLDVKKNDLISVIKIPRCTVGHIRQKCKETSDWLHCHIYGLW